MVAEGLKPSDSKVEWRKVAVQPFRVPTVGQELTTVSPPETKVALLGENT